MAGIKLKQAEGARQRSTPALIKNDPGREVEND